MGKRKHRDPAEREARENRRIARSQASLMRQSLLEAGINPEDIVSLNAEGFVGKRAHAVGTPENWPTVTPKTYEVDGFTVGPINSVTPPDENEGHDPTTTTG